MTRIHLHSSGKYIFTQPPNILCLCNTETLNQFPPHTHRPAPSLVRYSDEDLDDELDDGDDDDSAKGYDENPDESDSLTEKPSDISSSTEDSQASRIPRFCKHIF